MKDLMKAMIPYFSFFVIITELSFPAVVNELLIHITPMTTWRADNR